MKDVTEDVGLGRSGRIVKSQCPKGPCKKTKGKNRKIEKGSDVGQGNCASASFNTETDIMLQDDDTDLPKKRKGRNTDKRKVNKSNALDQVDKRDECHKTEEQMHENRET